MSDLANSRRMFKFEHFTYSPSLFGNHLFLVIYISLFPICFSSLIFTYVTDCHGLSIHLSIRPSMYVIIDLWIYDCIHAIFGKVMDSLSLSLSILVVHACIFVILPTVKYLKVGVCWCFWNWYRVCWLKVVEICSGECCWIDAVGYAVASEHWHM